MLCEHRYCIHVCMYILREIVQIGCTNTDLLAGIFWRTIFGGHFLADISWRTLSGGHLLANISWRRFSGGHFLADIFWRTFSGGHLLADIFWRTLFGGHLGRVPKHSQRLVGRVKGGHVVVKRSVNAL